MLGRYIFFCCFTFLLYILCTLHTVHTVVCFPRIAYCTHGTHILLLYTYCTLFTLYNLLNTLHNIRLRYFCFILYSAFLINVLTSVLQLWVYAYFPRLEPVPETETPLVVPFSCRYDERCTRRPRETFSFFRRYFDTITPAEVCFTYISFKLRFSPVYWQYQ